MKYLYLLIACFLCFTSCSNEEDENDAIDSFKEGQYLYVRNNDVVSLSMSKDKCINITIFIEGQVCYQNNEIRTEGSYPTYDIKVGELSSNEYMIHAVFKDNSLIATTTGYLESNLKVTPNAMEKNTKIDLPSSMTFKYDKTVLDINGDGILDSCQNL